MRKLIEFAVRRPITVLMLFAALAIFGGIGIFQLDLELLPPLQVPELLVSASYSGLPPADMRRLVTIPLEDALSSMKGIKYISSVSRQGSAVISLDFHWKTDLEAAGIEAREIIDTAYTALPRGTEKPLVLPVRPGEEAVVVLGIIPKSGDTAFARRLAEGEIKTRLQQVEGAGSIVLIGGTKREAAVLVDQEKAGGLGLSLGHIHSVLQASNISYPAGSIEEGTIEYIVKTDGEVTSLSGLNDLFIPSPADGEPIALRNIADIRLASAEQESIFHTQRGEGIGLAIRRQMGFSPVALSRNIREEIGFLERSFGRDFDFILLQDTSSIISSSLRSLLFSALIGSAAAFFVLFLFLRNISSALILIVSFPVSVLFALLFLALLGRSLNIMSLGGLVIGIGMLVDNGIVVIENLRRKVPSFKKDCETAVIEASAEMAGSTFGSTFTTLIVFIPVLFLPGVIGTLYTDLGLTVALSLIGSYLCSVLLLPVLYIFTLKREHMTAERKVRRGKTGIGEGYRRIFSVLLHRPVLVPVLAAALVGTGAFTFSLLEFQLMPDAPIREIRISAACPPGATMKRIRETGKALSTALMNTEEVESVYFRAGGEKEDLYYRADPEERRGIIRCTAVISEDGPEDLFDRLRLATENIDAEIEIERPENILAPILGIREKSSAIVVEGENQEKARRTGEELSRILESITEGEEGYVINIAPRGVKREINLKPIRDALSRTGLKPAGVGAEVRTALSGSVPAQLTLDGKKVDLRLRIDGGREKTPAELSRLLLLTPDVRPVSLGTVAEICLTENLHTLVRENKKDAVLLTVTPRPEAGSRLRIAIDREINRKKTLRYRSSSVVRESRFQILLTFGTALLLMYLLLGAQFESFLEPLVLLVSLPFAGSGIICGLVVSGNTLNINSSLGILVLLGIVVNNSIILFDTYKRICASGRSILGAVYLGSMQRVRPILMTMLTTVTALLPISLSPAGSSGQTGMAAAIIGGLIVSTVLTLTVQPFIFLSYFRRKGA